MDVFVLDSLLRRSNVIDTFESLIWTERFAAIGDFEMDIHSTNESRALLPIGARIAIPGSTRVMTVETLENKKDSEGRSILNVKGRSLEAMLEDRIAKQTQSNLTSNSQWVLTDDPANIAREVFKKICVDGTLSASDIIPFITTGNVYPPDTIPTPPDDVTMTLEIGTVYEIIKQICDIYDLGFRITRNYDLSQLYFNVYAGNDRTALQSTLPTVVFSPDLDNLADISELSSNALLKNVAYVYAPNGFEIVYASGADSSTAGFERRVLHVDAKDITLAAGAPLVAALQAKGREALAAHRSLSAFDGEIPQSGSYRYDRDYYLGDLVEMRNDDGVTNNMRVTEQIFVSDSQGDRSYPTLAIDLFITPGSWFAWNYNQTWDEALGFWADA